jgi:hypothetical protein
VKRLAVRPIEKKKAKKMQEEEYIIKNVAKTLRIMVNYPVQIS